MAVATSTAIALALAAAAAGTQYYNTQQTNKRLDRQTVASIQNQQGIQKEANAKVLQTLSDVDASSPAGERQRAADEYLKQVQGAQKLARTNLQQRGLSDEYDEGAVQAGDKAQEYATNIGSLMASIDAPSAQRANEGFRFGDLATDIGLVGSKSRGQQFVDALKAKGIRRNPYLDAAAALMNGAAGGVGTGSAVGAAAGSGGGGFTGSGLSGGYSSIGGYSDLFGGP